MKRVWRTFGLVVLAGSANLAALFPAAAEIEANYHCADGSVFVASFTPPDGKAGSADLVFADGRKLTLPQAISADGGRYVSGDTEFWIKGESANLTVGSKATHCRTIE